MDRKWRTNRGALDTVLSYPAFMEKIGPLNPTYKMCSLTDFYSVYTVLHIENKEWEVRWSEEGQFYFFIASQMVPQGGKYLIAPEGDEDMPAPIGDDEMERDGPADRIPRLVMGLQAAEYSDDDNFGGEEDSGGAVPAEATAAAAALPAGMLGPPVVRTQLLIPVSSSYMEITPVLLQQFFKVRGVEVQQIILGLVDSNGVVTRSCMYNYLQAPLEGPGTANLELLDD